MLKDLRIQLDFRHKISLSDQVQNQLRGLIQSGKLQSGNQLPTVRQLAAHLNINFNTVARAYRVLDEEGWISTQQGRGTYVLESSARESLSLDRVEPSDEEKSRYEAASPTDRQDTFSTVREPSISSGVSIASDAMKQLPEKTEPEKAKAINSWIERLINEAVQNHIAVEDLYQALGQRLVSNQANVEVSQRKVITRRPIKQSHKPLHQNPLLRRNRTSSIQTLRRKKFRSMKQ